jgi:hypothetical protein
MKRYWDSSALIDALQDSRIEAMALEPEQFTRPRALAESFSQITGGRLGIKVLADDAAALLDELTENFSFIELSAAEVREALHRPQENGVRGGRVHDWLHAVAAKKSGAAELLTNNFPDFEGLEAGFVVRSP